VKHRDEDEQNDQNGLNATTVTVVTVKPPKNEPGNVEVVKDIIER